MSRMIPLALEVYDAWLWPQLWPYANRHIPSGFVLDDAMKHFLRRGLAKAQPLGQERRRYHYGVEEANS
jgi:hypothetical protein